MALSKQQKRAKARLEEIKDLAVSYALNADQADAKSAANLAEEAAGLGLELLEEKED